MKQGKDLMGEQMPETLKVQNSLRVMFDDLPDEEKSEMINRLAGIAGVASVTWQPESEYYNKDNYTLFILPGVLAACDRLVVRRKKEAD